MGAVTIDRACLCLRLPESQLGWRSALADLHERVVRAAVEVVGREQGWGDALVCLRGVSVELRMTPSELGAGTLGSAAARRWQAALIGELRRTMREGEPQRVVRYASPIAALVDMGRGLARHDLRRAWAWAQLGFVDRPTRATASRRDGAEPSVSLAQLRQGFVRALLERPELCVGVVAQLAREPECFERLLDSMSAEVWLELSAAASRVHGSVEVHESHAATGDHADVSSRELADVRWFERLAACSAIAGALVSAAATRVDTRTLAALLRLAVLDAAPTAVRRTSSAITAVELERAQQLRRHASGEVEREPTGAVEREPTSEPLSAWRDEVEDVRARACSMWGGLLLLLAIFREAQLWDELDGLARALELEFEAVVHELGRVLVAEPIEPNDPALLAFIGRPPDAEPPDALELDRAERLHEALGGVYARLLAILDDRLQRRPERGPALLAWLLRRRAELIGEPGWIEIHFELREVDLEVRRAGLDVDPNWIPALGVVMRFVYG